MAGSKCQSFLWRLVLLPLAASIPGLAAHAAPGFVADSHVERGPVFAELTIEFRCGIQYLDHDPAAASDVLRIRLESTTVCTGASPTVANSREQHRPVAADDAKIVSIEYDGEVPGDRQLRVNFSEDVRFDVRAGANGNTLLVRVFTQAASQAQAPAVTGTVARQVQRVEPPVPKYVINLESTQRPPATADMPEIAVSDGTRLFVTEADIGGRAWYRIRVGYFASAEAASRELQRFREQFPGAWIDRADAVDEVADVTPVADAPAVAARPAQPARDADVASPAAVAATTASASAIPAVQAAAPAAEAQSSRPAAALSSSSSVEELMQEGRRAMTAGELPRAVQVYTKVLQLPANEYQPQAQEYLALARERNGQVAHARAEYQRYLEVYPDAEGTERVRQRLAALLATGGSTAVASGGPTRADGASAAQASVPSKWKLRTFLSQYYRRDVNQLNDQEEIVSQSSIYTDASIDARYRGERFDFSSRITAGYRTDLMKEERPSSSLSNDFRLSYAYADLADARTGLRGRLGRQTRNTGGVLGRFDGLNLTYALNERVYFEAVAGIPVYSTARSVDDSRTFHGLSSTFSPFSENLELGLFLLQQDIDGLTDREAMGAELRYSGATTSLWGIADYDAAFQELGSVFLQGSWRLPGKFTVTGLVDRRRSPFLSLGNAIVGQQGEEFENLAVLMSEDEIRQLALDRSAVTTTYTLGMSRPVSPKLQVNLNASLASVEATPESGGVAATPAAEYSYYSADFVASGLFRQGDVGILGLRYAISDNTNVYTVNLDARFPIGSGWRFSPRLRVDYREINTDDSTQWIYTPGLRLQYRWGRRLRLELEAGKQYSQRDMAETDQDRESYFINLGYQYFY